MRRRYRSLLQVLSVAMVVCVALISCGAPSATISRSLGTPTSTEAIEMAAFSPGGALLATANPDATITIWDMASGQRRFTLAGQGGTVTALAFSPDGKSLASGGTDKRIELWDVTTGKEMRALSGHTSGVSAVTFSPDGKTLASGGTDGAVKQWDVSSGTAKQSLSVGVAGGVTSLAYSPDGKSLASGGGNASVQLWNPASGQLTRNFTGHKDAVGTLAFSPDGQSLATGSNDRDVKLWSVQDGKEQRSLTGHTGAVDAVAFSPDGKSLASGSVDKTARLWDATNGQTKQTLTGHTAAVPAVAFSPDGKSLATGSRDNSARQWDAASGKLQKSINVSPQTGTSPVAGLWDSNYGPVTLITQPAAGGTFSVTGYWYQGGDPATCDPASCKGTIKSGSYNPATRALTIAYYQPWNQVDGTAQFTLVSPTELDGTFDQPNGSGDWVLTRPKASATPVATRAAGAIPTPTTAVPAGPPGTLALNGPAVAVAITAANQPTTLTFAGTGGRRVSFAVTNLTLKEAYLTVLKPDGSTVGSIYMYQPENFFDATALTASGTYTVKLEGLNGATGTASITGYDFVDTTGTIAPGGTSVPVAVSIPGQNARLTFQGKKGQQISANVQGMTATEANLALLGPDGATVHSIYMYQPSTFFDSATLPSDGTYTFVFDPHETALGGATIIAYTFADTTGTITPGGAGVPVAVSIPGQNARLTFQGKKGQQISANVAGMTAKEANLALLGPDGATIHSIYMYQPETFFDTAALPADGTYTLLFDPHEMELGGATITAYIVTDRVGQIAIGGAPVQVTIDTPGQNARLTFQGKAGQKITVTVDPLAVAENDVLILNPDGSKLAGGYIYQRGQTLEATLPANATYTLVFDPHYADLGTATISLK